MKKFLMTFFLLAAIFLSSTDTSRAAPLADGIVVLVEARNDTRGGVIFVFNYTGEFPKSFFKGFVTVGDEKYPLACNVQGDGLVQCTSSRAMAGSNVVVHLGNLIFWTFVPEGGATETIRYCYPVYDVVYDEETEEHNWTQIAEECQDLPASYGDELDMGDDFFYLFEFLPGAPCFNPITGDAYYGACPS